MSTSLDADRNAYPACGVHRRAPHMATPDKRAPSSLLARLTSLLARLTSLLARLSSLRALVHRWRRVATERRALGALDPSRLRDLGVDPVDADREAARPFWDIPAAGRR